MGFSHESPNSAKFISALILGLLRFSCAYIPLSAYKALTTNDAKNIKPLNEKQKRKIYRNILIFHSFGGGVLLATCVLHMMPELHDLITSCEYPVSQLLVCVGFFIIYFLEDISQWFISRVPDKPFIYNVDYLDTNQPRTQSQCNGACLISTIGEQLNINDIVSVEEQAEKLENNEKKVVINLRQYVRHAMIYIAMSGHALFEGLAIGLQFSRANIWYLCIAMSIHSATSLLCIGFKLLLYRATRKTIIGHFLVLALSCPAGICLGMLILEQSELNFKQQRLTDGILESISTGIILYITFFEVLRKEKMQKLYRFKRNVTIVIGFSLMAALEYYKDMLFK